MTLRANPDEYLRTLARDNAQLLINEIWKLPFERVDDVIITKLPKATYILPREKPAPKAKTLTKWESYAKEKGITKRKKTKLVWDELVKVCGRNNDNNYIIAEFKMISDENHYY